MAGNSLRISGRTIWRINNPQDLKDLIADLQQAAKRSARSGGLHTVVRRENGLPEQQERGSFGCIVFEIWLPADGMRPDEST